MRPVRSNLLMIPLFLAIATTAHASIWYVNGARGRDINNCTSAQTACKTIGHATKLLVGAGWWYLNKSSAPAASETVPLPTTQQNVNSGTQPVVNNHPTQTYMPPKTTSQPSGTASAWHTYRSSYGFEIQYPPAWKIVTEAGDGKVPDPSRVVSFGTGTFGDQGYDGEFFVFAYDKSSTNVEQYIKDMGKQFSDRQEKRENITINGVSAVKVVVTTPSVPTWDYEAVIVEQQNRFYVMHNGAVKVDSFTDFYKSFKLRQRKT